MSKRFEISEKIEMAKDHNSFEDLNIRFISPACLRCNKYISKKCKGIFKKKLAKDQQANRCYIDISIY